MLAAQQKHPCFKIKLLALNLPPRGLFLLTTVTLLEFIIMLIMQLID